MNEEIYSMFDDYSQTFKKKWGRIFHNGVISIENALRDEANKIGYTIQRSGRDLLWVDRRNTVEALFRFIPDPFNILLFQNIYQKIRKTNAPVAFVIVHQTVDGEGNYDVFRFSERSFLEHHNRARYRKK